MPPVDHSSALRDSSSGSLAMLAAIRRASSFVSTRACRACLLQDFHLAINAQHLSHLFRKVGVAALQIVAHFVRLHVFLVEDFAHRALRQVGEARMPFRGPMLAGVPGEKPRRPQFVRIAEVPRLAATLSHRTCRSTTLKNGRALKSPAR